MEYCIFKKKKIILKVYECKKWVVGNYEYMNTTNTDGMCFKPTRITVPILDAKLSLGFLVHFKPTLTLSHILLLFLLNFAFGQKQSARCYEGKNASNSNAKWPTKEIIIVSRHPIISVCPESKYQRCQGSRNSWK